MLCFSLKEVRRAKISGRLGSGNFPQRLILKCCVYFMVEGEKMFGDPAGDSSLKRMLSSSKEVD